MPGTSLGRDVKRHVTPLQASHASAYRDLMLEAYELAADSFTSTVAERAAEPPSWWVKRIADPTGMSIALGAFDDKDLVGTVAIEFSAKPKTKHRAHLIGMYVSPRARGTGAGRALLQAAIERVEAREDILVLNLTVTEGNAPAVNLYLGAGFQAFGTEPMAILTPGGFKAKIHMWRQVSRRGNAP